METHTLKIQFRKSTSSNYDAVIKLTKKFDNFNQIDKTSEIKINMSELQKKYLMVQKLLSFISSWKYTSISFDDNEIDVSSVYTMYQILFCCNKHEYSNDRGFFLLFKQQQSYCWLAV